MLHRDSTTRTYTRPDAPAPRPASTQHRRRHSPAHLRGDRRCRGAPRVRPLVSGPVQVPGRRARSLPARHLRRRRPRTRADVRRLQSSQGLAAPALGSDHHRRHPARGPRLWAAHRVRGAAGRDGLRGRSASPRHRKRRPAEDLLLARPPYDRLSWTGPSLLGARAPEPGPEHNDALFKALEGTDVSSRPQFWQPYERSKAAALARSRAVAMLLSHYPAQADETRRRLADMGAEESTARFLPAMARGEWVAVLNATGDVLGYLPLDGFF